MLKTYHFFTSLFVVTTVIILALMFAACGHGQQKELLGNKRLLELMADTQSLDSRQVIDKLKKAVEQHRNGAEPNDDLTLMCIRFERV